MEPTVISAAEAAEFVEFKRTRREAEVSLTLNKLIVDASHRETDRHTLKAACDAAVKLRAYGVLVSPVNVAPARKTLAASEVNIVALVGGTGESLVAIKKAEAKKAMRQGARVIRLVLCYSALAGGNAAYLKREVKRVRRAVKKCTLVLSLEDHSLGEEEIARGVRAACEGKADGVCVRGETGLVLRAAKAAAGKLETEASAVENAEQLRLVIKAGAVRATVLRGEEIAKELYRAAEEPPLPPQPLAEVQEES